MNQGKYISPDIFVFSKWSRKEYAVFASLGKLIKIGVLKADICQKALLKKLVELKKIANLSEDFEEDEPDLNIADYNSLQFLLSSLGLSIFQTINLATIKKSREVNPLKKYYSANIKSVFTKCNKRAFFYLMQKKIKNR